jgi:gamma-glutamyl:cysteine ligase YbdK (ATP-grasp superfamily)
VNKRKSFHSLTVGYDWEMAVLKNTAESIGEDKIKKIANEMRQKLPWARVGIDIDLLELRMEAVSHWDEFRERNRLLLDCAKKIAARKGYTILPIGARPTEQMPIGSHIHIGTVPDFTTATQITNTVIPYVPCLIALACNSPFSRFKKGEFKSYRIIYNAEWCSLPIEIRIPQTARGGWGEDVQVRLPRKPTIEIRCLDSSSDFTLMEEYVALTAGLLYGIAKKRSPQSNREKMVKWQSINRYRAAKDGLQAIFRWKGKERPVTEIFGEIFSLAEEGMRIFGASIEDLSMIKKMIEKKQTQADFLLLLSNLESDPHALLKNIMNIYSHENAFKVYLRKAKKLTSRKPTKIEDHILSRITKETPYFHLSIVSPLPPHMLNSILNRFEREGKVTSRVSSYDGLLYSRTDLL